jgi:hypothetical protein
MAVSFAVFPERGLVYVKYAGMAGIDETMRTMQAYMYHPDFRPGQKQLLDLSEVTGIDRDYPRFMAMAAQTLDMFVHGAAEHLIVYYVPTPIAREMAEMAIRSWADVQGVVTLLQEDEAEALALLGLRERSFAALFEGVR